MKKRLLFIGIVILCLQNSWSFTMYLVSQGGIEKIGTMENNYIRLPNLQKEDFGLYGNFSSYDIRVRGETNEWEVLEKSIINFGPNGKKAVAFKCDQDNCVLILNDLYNGNYKMVDNFFKQYNNFPGSYYEWYIFNDEEIYKNFIYNLLNQDDYIE